MTLAAEILADSPLGFWKLDETSGTTATDSSGNGRHGTYTDASMAGASPGPCAVGGVSPLFGAGDYVTVPSAAAWSIPSTLTIEALVRRAVGAPAVTTILSHDPVFDDALGDAPANDCYNTYAFENGAEIESNNRTPFLDGILPCSYDGKWAHVVFTKTGTASGGTKIYINGMLAVTGACADFETGMRGLLIGRRGWNTSPFPMVGNLSHVAIYSSVLSAARVEAHAHASSCPSLCWKPWNIGSIAI